MSWRDRRLFAIRQAGLVEKFVDALVWALFPVFLVTRGASLTGVGWIVGVYGFVCRLHRWRDGTKVTLDQKDRGRDCAVCVPLI